MSCGARKTVLSVLIDHYDDLLRYLARGLGGSADACDVIQDTFVKLQNLPAGTEVGNPRAYLFRVAGNQMIDHIRRQQTRSRYIGGGEMFDAPADEPSQEDVLYYRQRLERLERTITNLPPRQREVFLMHKFDELTHGEIAQKLGISKSAVEKLMMKALATCRDQLDDLSE